MRQTVKALDKGLEWKRSRAGVEMEAYKAMTTIGVPLNTLDSGYGVNAIGCLEEILFGDNLMASNLVKEEVSKLEGIILKSRNWDMIISLLLPIYRFHGVCGLDFTRLFMIIQEEFDDLSACHQAEIAEFLLSIPVEMIHRIRPELSVFVATRITDSQIIDRPAIFMPLLKIFWRMANISELAERCRSGERDIQGYLMRLFQLGDEYDDHDLCRTVREIMGEEIFTNLQEKLCSLSAM